MPRAHLHPVATTHNAAGRRACGAALLLLAATGCGSGGSPDTTQPPATVQAPQTYFAPYVGGNNNGGTGTILAGPNIYSIDHVKNTFTQSTFQLVPLTQQGSQVINTGPVAAGARGLLNLSIATNYSAAGGANVYSPTNYATPKSGGFAVELANQAGALVQLPGQPVSPMAAAVQCPSLKTAQTYLFLTIPGSRLDTTPDPIPTTTWNPATDTAFGTVDIATNGTAVTLSNIRQRTLPSTGGSGAPVQAPSSATGACGPTVYGNTITVGQVSISNPQPGNPSTPPQASIGIGPSGLLVEDNGSLATIKFPNTNPALLYDNTLGAGTGAVGLPRPTAALDAGALAGAQYLGFVYSGATYSGNYLAPPLGWSSHLASFGFPAVPSTCASLGVSGSTVLYGGGYTNDDPSTASSGYGNCELAIDLGTQDSSTNGLFLNAKVTLGGSYAANTTKKTYSFPAVAIAGKLTDGKYALFLLGIDSTQGWSIYLLQSN